MTMRPNALLPAPVSRNFRESHYTMNIMLPTPRAPIPALASRTPDSASWAIVRRVRGQLEAAQACLKLAERAGLVEVAAAARRAIADREAALTRATDEARRLAEGAK